MSPRTQNLASPKKEYIRWRKDTSRKDIQLVGAKNAMLGEMYSKLTDKGINIPNGFAVTAQAYWAFLEQDGLKKKIKEILKHLDATNGKELTTKGKKVRDMIIAASLPEEISKEILLAYKQLHNSTTGSSAVAVRSSVVLPELSSDVHIAGQQETYLNVHGDEAVLLAVKHCIASLFTNRAIAYREAKALDHLAFALSIGVEELVGADRGASGELSTSDSESGFSGIININASYGFGLLETKVRASSDRFSVFKKGVQQGKEAVVSRDLGKKETKAVCAKKQGITHQKVRARDRNIFSITNTEVVTLAKWGMQIEEQFGCAQDIAWVKDGQTGKLFIVQTKDTVVTTPSTHAWIETYTLKKTGKEILRGTPVGQKIGAGKVRIIGTLKEATSFKKGEILVTSATEPEWELIMRLASAIITEQGDRTSHAATVARELGIPCLVGVANARKELKTGEAVTLSCVGGVGIVYQGILPFEMRKTEIAPLPKTKTKIMMNVGDPDNAFALSQLPNDGVGLAREESIFTNIIRIHPLALVHYDKLKDKKEKKKIAELTRGYKKKTAYCVEKLAEGMSRIAAGVYPKPVIFRLSDGKSNEYASLIGGKQFEPKETGPMTRLRGAMRYYAKEYSDAFKLECEAIKKARNDWGLTNIIVMIPFCRTPEEGEKVLNMMQEFGLKRGENGLEIHVMCEIPSNVILAKEFGKLFDGFSIGANELTQLTLGIDQSTAHGYDENNEAVKTMIRDVIDVAHSMRRKVSICGQAPSDHPEFTEFLVRAGIDSISLNPDAVVSTRHAVAGVEKTLGKLGKKTNAKYLSMVAAFGIVCAGFIGLGAGCADMGKKDVAPQVAEISPAQLRERMEQKVLEEKNEEMSTYSMSTFTNVTLQYPSSWRVSQWSGGVAMGDTTSGEYVSIFKQLVDHPVPDEQRDHVVIDGKNATIFKVVSNETTAYPIPLNVVEIPLDNNVVLEINGVTDRFDRILQSVKFIESDQSSTGASTHWDVREKRLCFQMITYARQNKTSKCVAYPTPCDVPENWQVCDAGDIGSGAL